MNVSQSSSIEQPQHAPRRVRIESVDVLRGLVMVIKALDHTREFFSNYGGNPTDAATAPGIIFFTRWITHKGDRRCVRTTRRASSRPRSTLAVPSPLTVAAPQNRLSSQAKAIAAM